MLFCFTAQACEVESECVEQSSWKLGVAIGVGARSNPLVDGDTMPMIILPDIAWYGEAAYFDNGELGYQWLAEDKFAVETFVVFDTERAFFSFWEPSNVLFNTDVMTSSLPGFDTELASPNVSINDIAHRDWTINAGIRGHYYTPNGEWTASWQHDALNVHKGNKFELGYRHRWRVDDWRLSLGFTAHWKSQELLDYYYGLSFRDGVPLDLLYEARAGWQPQISMGLSHPISDNWQFLFRATYRKLNSGMTDSPLVDKKSVQSVFIGAAYRF